MFLALTVIPCRAAVPLDESFSVRVWQAEDGLPENRVVGVAQATDGYLWVATQVGVVRFDGVRFQPVMLSDEGELFSGMMRGLLLDRDGRVWVTREGGRIICIEGGLVRALTPDDGLPANEAQRSLAVDGEGALWVSFSTGRIIRFKDGQVENFTTREGVPPGGAAGLASGRDGKLWFVKNGRVGLVREGRFETRLNLETPVVRIAPARTGGLWICAGERLLRFEDGTDPVLFGSLPAGTAAERAAVEATVLHEDRQGAVWVGTLSAGLFRCDSNSIVRVAVSHPSILSLAEDREGNLWVGTRGGGLDRLHRRVTSMLQAPGGLPFEAVQSLCQDAEGRLWVVGENGVLAREQNGQWTPMTVDRNAPNIFINCVVADANGTVWAGTRGGAVYHWVGGRFVGLGLREGLGGRSVRGLLVSRAGDLWIATDASDVLHRLRTEKMQLQKYELKPGYRFIRALTEDAAGNIWAGGSDGTLVRVTGDELVNETQLTGGLSVRALHGAPNGDVWIGFAGLGAGRIRNGGYQRFSREQGMPNNYVSQILTDGRGSVWFAGNQGIFQVRERDFDDVAAGRAARVSPVVYGRNEGMLGLQASFDFAPAAHRSADQRLFFSMLTGVAEVRLDHARLNRLPPVVFIETVLADGQTVAARPGGRLVSQTNTTGPLDLSRSPTRRELRLGPGLQSVQFEFTALSFTAPENVRFRYQLEGLDEDWVDAGPRRVADYTYPPPGSYRFKVIACNNDGVWNEVGDSLAVIFEPHFWETWWFKFTTVALISGALCGGVVFVLRRRHRLQIERLEQQRALERERSRIAHDLHDDLGVGLTEIGLLGDLAGAAATQPEAARECVQEMTGRARSLVAALDEIVWAVNPANDTSQSLVDYFFHYAQKLLRHASVRCRLEVVEPLPAGSLKAEQRHQIFHAFKEALNNVIRHSGATEVRVTLGGRDGKLLVCVADNGRGIASTDDKGARLGLTGMEERLRHLGGQCEIASRSGEGTTVTFIVPIENKAS